MRIRDKRQMYDLLMHGKLGNTLSLWLSVDEMVDSGFDGKWAIRSLKPRGEFLPNLPSPMSVAYGMSQLAYDQYLARNHCGPSDVILAEMDADGGRRIFSGEITRYPTHNTNSSLVLHYSTMDNLFRTAMAGIDARASSTAYGCRAIAMLQKYLDPGDLDCITELLDEYTDSIVEFTCFERPLGWAHKRMVVWEVRSDY